MVKTKQCISNRLLSIALAFVMALTILVGTTTVAKADSSTATYDPPTQAMAVDESIITATAHRAASPILGMMGLNAVSGFGMINGSAPTDLASAQKCAAIGIWGTAINDNPDPYYWNYFYNFYVDAYPELGLAKSDDALMNPGAAASPMQADTTLVEEYGNVSVSLSTRPEVVIGTAARGAAESDTHGYDDQIATINSFTPESEYYHEGDEDYAPYLVPYTRATLVDMIASAKRIGAAMDEITDLSNGFKIGRYADENSHSSYIADNYENFIYGLQAYILSKIDTKKTVAIVSSVNDDGTFTIADASTQEATSSNRYVEYTDIVGDNIAATLGTVVTAEQLAATDVIILSNFNSEGFTDASGQAVTFYELLKGQNGYNENQIIIENYPSALYGITMNSVENAMGMAYITSFMYNDNPNVGLDPVSMCAYYYQKFYHISDLNNLKEAIAINFANVTLPAGLAGTLSDSYDPGAIETKILEGAGYYLANPDAFASTYIGKAGWAPTDYLEPEVPIEPETPEEPIVTPVSISNAKVTLSKTTVTYNGQARKPSAKVVLDGVTLKLNRDYTVSYSNNKNAGTATVTIKGTGDYTGKAKATFKIQKAANKITNIKPSAKNYKVATLKKKNVAFNMSAKALGSAKITYKLSSVTAKGKKYISVSSAGKVTIKKGIPKGTYRIKVKITAKATSNYKAKAVTKTIIVKVK